MRKPTRRNPPLLCLYHGLMMSLFPMAIITIFYKHQIGMNLFDIMLLQGAFGLAMVLFEFPSGFLADRIGYRASLIGASALHAVGWGIYSEATTFWQVAAAEVFLGIGTTLISGCDKALLYESLLESDEELEYTSWMGRFEFSGQFAEGSAALVAGLLFAWWTKSVFYLEVGIWLVNLIIAWRLVEPHRERPRMGESLQQMRGMIRHAFRDNTDLRLVFSLGIVLGLSSFVPVWTIQLYATESGLPEAWLGPLWAIANFSVALGAIVAARAEKKLGLTRFVWAWAFLIALGYGGLSTSHAVWGCAFYFALTFMRGLNGPVMSHREQRLVPSSDRAGFLSLKSFAFRASFLILGPLVGWMMVRYEQRPVLSVLGVVFVLTVIWLRAGIRVARDD